MAGCYSLLALAFLRRLDHAALGLDRCERAVVDVVDIAADLQLAGFVDECVLVSQQDPDLRRQLDVLLARAEHPLDLVCRPVLGRTRNVEENFGIFGRILHAHAAVAIRAHIMREHVLVRRVVLVDQEPIGEIEPYASERIRLAGRLKDVHAAVPVISHSQPHPLERRRVSLQPGQIFIVDDRGRHVPGRIDGDELHRLTEQRRRHVLLADYDSGAPDLGAVVCHA